MHFEKIFSAIIVAALASAGSAQASVSFEPVGTYSGNGCSGAKSEEIDGLVQGQTDFGSSDEDEGGDDVSKAPCSYNGSDVVVKLEFDDDNKVTTAFVNPDYAAVFNPDWITFSGADDSGTWTYEPVDGDDFFASLAPGITAYYIKYGSKGGNSGSNGNGGNSGNGRANGNGQGPGSDGDTGDDETDGSLKVYELAGASAFFGDPDLSFEWSTGNGTGLSNAVFFNAPVPVPPAFFALGLGLAGLGYAARRQRRAKAT